MKSLTIIGRRWFQKGPGNTYYSSVALINGNQVAAINYAYGYGSQYEWDMFKVLELKGLLPTAVEHYPSGSSESAWRWCERNQVAFSSHVMDVQRKKDLT